MTSALLLPAAVITLLGFRLLFQLCSRWHIPNDLLGMMLLPAACLLAVATAQVVNHREALSERLWWNGWNGWTRGNAIHSLGILLLLLPAVWGVNLATVRLFEFCHWPVSEPVLQTLFRHADWFTVIRIAFCAVIVAPIVEEIVFRRVLFTAAGSYLGVGWGVIITALLFASVHDCRTQMPALFLLGVLLQLLFLERRSLAVPILVHMGNNALAIGMLILARIFGWNWVFDL